MLFGQLIRTGIVAAAFAALPVVAQNTDQNTQSGAQPGTPPAATDTTRGDMNRDTTYREHHDFGWLGLIGLAGLIGLWRGSSRTDVGARRTGPNM